MMLRRRLWTFACYILFIAFSAQAGAESNHKKSSNELVFGVLPFLSPVVLIKRFTPLKDYLERITGKTIYLESAPNFPEFVKRTLAHEYDIIFTAPHLVPVTLDDKHYQLIVASNKLAAHIMVKGDSKLTDLKQLAGKRVALGPSQAFVVIIAKYLLKTQGLTGKNAPIYSNYKSHNATLRALEFDDADAAVIGSYLLDIAQAKGDREIGSTHYYPGAAFLASSDIPESLRNKISDAFLNIKNTKEGRRTLKLIQFPGFQKTVPSEYDELRPVAEDAFSIATRMNP
jgi:phosphonate transport system substrate-binding protein